MTPLTWIYMGIVWAAIIALNVFCFSRIFMKKRNGNSSDPDGQ